MLDLQMLVPWVSGVSRVTLVLKIVCFDGVLDEAPLALVWLRIMGPEA